MKSRPVNQFLFRREYLEQIKKIVPREVQLATLLAVIEYGLSDCDAWSITEFDEMNKNSFCRCMSQIIEDSITIRDDIEAAAKKAENFGKVATK